MITLSEIKLFFGNFPSIATKEIALVSYDELSKYFTDFSMKFLKDEDNLIISNPRLNIWEGIDIGRSELKHCSFLTWLLDPWANHYQKKIFLKCFFEYLQLNSFMPLLNNDNIRVSKEDLIADLGRTDIKILSKDFIVIIEAKIDAGEQDNQIDRYREIMEINRASLGISHEFCKIIFLTSEGRSPVSGEAQINISWRDIANVCKEFNKDCKNEFVKQTVEQYMNFILRYI